MKENIVIIGGGAAGLEAAYQLLTLGYTPIIIEKSGHLGGHLYDWNRLFPDMTPAKQVAKDMMDRVKDANIFLNTQILSIEKSGDSYSIVLDNGISITCTAVLVTTGFQLFDAHRKEEYGYGIYDHVITNKDLEGWFNGNGDKRVDDSNGIKAVGFVHCVGSRDVKAGNSQCSKVCCITAIKQAIEMKEKYPDAEVYCFYMDLRMFGKKYEDFYINGQRDHGIHFIRGRVSEVSENIDGKVIVKAEDTLNGKPIKVTLDLLVLMAGIVCNSDTSKLAAALKLPTDTDGFLKSKDNVLNIIESPKEGIFYAGACTGPKTVPETVAEARAAALAIHNHINSRKTWTSDSE